MTSREKVLTALSRREGRSIRSRIRRCSPTSRTARSRSGPGTTASGGYVIGPTHSANRDVSWEHISAFYEAVRNYG